jgi:hypothetical protein
VFIQITFFIQVAFLKEGMLHSRLSPDKFKSLEMGYVLNFVTLSFCCSYFVLLATYNRVLVHTVEIVSC